MKHKTLFFNVLLVAALTMVSAFAGEVAPEQRVVPAGRGQLILSYAPVVRQVAHAVVNIYTKKRIKVQAWRSPFADDPFFRQFFGGGSTGAPQERIQRALGSGVIVRANGYIVTSNHVIAGADEITVALSDRREYPAKVMLADASTDLAILKIDAKGEALPYLTLRDSDSLQVGDVVLAIGDPFGVGQTVTSGIVSALARTNVGISDYQFFIQTDAAINPGNSGGALVTMDGKLAGINTAIYSQSGGSIGIGFAIPSNMVSSVLTAALTHGKIFRPWVGAGGQEVTADIAKSMGLTRPGGVLINQLYPGGPAALAGIKVGDIIQEVSGQPVDSIEGLRFRLRLGSGPTEKKVPMIIFRDGHKLTIELSLQRAPEVPLREITTIAEDNFFRGVKLGNLSPAFAEELQLDPFQSGVVVLGLSDNSLPAQYGLLQPKDILLKVNGVAVKTVAELKAAMALKSPFSYRMLRGDKAIECGEGRGGSFGCRQ